MPSPFPCNSVIREWLWTKTQIEKNGPKSLPKNLPNCPILYNWVFINFILAEELFAKSLWSLETCVLVNINLCEKLVSSLELPN